MLTGRTRLLSLYLHAQGHYTTTHADTEQMTLILKHSNKNRLGTIDRGPNDFDVCESDCCIGRIFHAPQSPPDRSWMRTVTAREYPRTIHSRGYSATREQAMEDFKAQWLRLSK
jgi:hypothetical protein